MSSAKLRLGGMALRNGLLVHGPTHWAAAVRAPDGEIALASGPKPVLARGRSGEVPMIRGPLRLAEGMLVIPLARTRLRAARLPLEDPAVLAAVAASLAGSSLARQAARSALAGELAGTALGIVPALVALRDRDLAAYHGVEHKAIGAYERGSDDLAAVPKEHERCGSNLIAPMVACSLAAQAVLRRLVRRPGPVARSIAGLAGLAGSVELFAYAERNPRSALGRAVRGVGFELQRRLSTREPSPEQLEVGRAAIAEALRLEAVPADV